MRAIVLADGELHLETIPDPTPASGQLLVRTTMNGICGSDLHWLHRPGTRARRHDDPLVLGHEFCAEVLDYGPSTEDRPFPIGGLVCANPFTEAGGIVNPGGLAEMMVLDVSRAFSVPEHVPADEAVLTEPLAVGIRAVTVAESLPGGAPYVVYGCGPVGLSIILGLHALGHGPIVATDLSPVRLAAAAQVGADLVIDAKEGSVFSQLEALGFEPQPNSEHLAHGATQGIGITIFECTGAPNILSTLMDAAPKHTSIVVAGVSNAVDSINPMLGIHKELSIGYARAYRQDELVLALKRIADGVVDTSPMITAKVPLAETPWAFQALLDAEQVKVVVEPNL